MVAPTGEQLELLALEVQRSARRDPVAAHARAVEAGGRSVWAPRETPAPGPRIAFVADLDGDLVELLLAQAAPVTPDAVSGADLQASRWRRSVPRRGDAGGAWLTPLSSGSQARWRTVRVRDHEGRARRRWRR